MPALDGLRTVAVMLVVAFHAGIDQLRGGFIGVDLFFVLSGFVIVRAMLGEYDRSGAVSFSGFWRRRIARLMPAAVVCIVITGALFTLTSSPPERVDVLSDGRASLLSVSNWWFLRQSTDYFRDALDASPFLHMWSLSVEEQFYLAMPLLFLAGARWARRPRAWMIGAASLTAVAVGWNVAAQSRWSELRVYFGTDTRAYQVLAGVTAAVVLWSAPAAARAIAVGRPRTAVLAVSWAGLGVLAVVDGLDPNLRGSLVTVAALGLIVPLASGAGGWTATVLGTRPLVAVGAISYGVYLWHWPVIIVLQRIFVLGERTLLVAATAISLLLAGVMRTLLELPAIEWARRPHVGRRRMLPFGLLLAPLLAVAIALPLVLTTSVAPLAAAPRPGFSTGAVGVATPTDLAVPADLGYSGFAPFDTGSYCINTTELTGDCLMVDGGDLKVMVIGDSHADDLLPALANLARPNGFSLYAVVTAGCPWQAAFAYVGFDTPSCIAAQDAVYGDLVERVRPDIIVVASHPHEETGFELRSRDETGAGVDIEQDGFVSATIESARALTAHGARLVMIEPRPSAPSNAEVCLAASALIDDCAFVVGPQAAAEALRLRAVAAEVPTAISVDIDDMVCPRLPVCDPILRGTIVRYDGDHLYAGFVQQIGQALWDRIVLAANG